MKLKSLIIGVFTILLSASSIAQEVAPCGHTKAERELRENHPELLETIRKAEQELQESAKNYVEQRSMLTYVVPVVFHVIHEDGEENISDEQIHDAIRILNEDFSKQNADANDVVSGFTPANAQIEFRLAKRDEAGDCHSGITRTKSYLTNDGSQTMKNLIQWDRRKYLNVWTCKYADGAAGYAYYPSTVSAQPWKDGIVLLHDYVGSIGTSSYERGRSLTHEVGHWIDLRHTWGDSNDPGVGCGSDGVADTPRTKGWITCTLDGTTCDTDLDNVENFMEYSYCSKMFTEGQKSKMRVALESTVSQRRNLWQASNLAATGVDETLWLCLSDFSANKTEACAGEPIIFNDDSYNDVATRKWTFTGGNANSTTSSSPTVTYNTPGVYNVSLTVNDGAGTSKSKTQSNYITILPADGAKSPYWEGFENNPVPGEKWFVSGDNQLWTANSTAAYGGSKSITVKNYSNNKEEVAEVLSSTINLSTNATATITFKYAYAQRSTKNNDKLRLYVSNDCGENWSLTDVLSGISSLKTASTHTSSFVPNGKGEWKSRTKTISSSKLSEGFRFKFEVTNDGGNNIYIDDIYISGTPVGIDELDKNPFSLKVYPNPVVGKANVDFELKNTNHVTVSVINLVGKNISVIADRNFSAGKQHLSFNTNNIAKGIYFVKVTANGRDVVQKIIVK